jgi:hypothetical protein
MVIESTNGSKILVIYFDTSFQSNPPLAHPNAGIAIDEIRRTVISSIIRFKPFSIQINLDGFLQWSLVAKLKI